MDSVAEIGSTANSYQVLVKLATGGMAEIFLARSAGLGAVQRYVVLKRVLRERAGDVQSATCRPSRRAAPDREAHPRIAQRAMIGSTYAAEQRGI